MHLQSVSESSILPSIRPRWQRNITVFISHDSDYVDTCLLIQSFVCWKLNAQSHGFLNFHTPMKTNKGKHIHTHRMCMPFKYIVTVQISFKNGKLSPYELCTLGQGYKTTNMICHSFQGYLRLSCWSSYISIRSVLLGDEFMINYTLTANDRRRIPGCNDGSAEDRVL